MEGASLKQEITDQFNELQKLTSSSVKIPDEFYDPLTGEIMKDPITLPETNNVVDRSTLENPLYFPINERGELKNPYNTKDYLRTAFKPDEVLRDRINEFFKQNPELKGDGEG